MSTSGQYRTNPILSVFCSCGWAKNVVEERDVVFTFYTSRPSTMNVNEIIHLQVHSLAPGRIFDPKVYHFWAR